jgi:hypothetical protein
MRKNNVTRPSQAIGVIPSASSLKEVIWLGAQAMRAVSARVRAPGIFLLFFVETPK